MPMTRQSPAQDVLDKIAALLDERITFAEGQPDSSVYERVLDVVMAYEFWSELARRRLHQIHRLSDQECTFCPKWPDGEV